MAVILAVADMARPNPSLTNAFVAEMARRLQGQSPALGHTTDMDRTAIVGTGVLHRADGADGEPAAGGRSGS